MPVTNELIEKLQERIQVEARKRKVRWTGQRQLIVEQFLYAAEHITADQLYARVRQSDPSIGAATVYRTLNLLVEIGAAQRVRFGSGSAAYEPALDRAHHDHLICLACGIVVEFEDERIEARQRKIAQENGFILRHHRLEMFGLCPACQKRVVGDGVSAS